LRRQRDGYWLVAPAGGVAYPAPELDPDFDPEP
jgi:hypothetical protein